MLLQPDKNELGDKRLDPKEALAKETAECLQMASQYRIPGQDELEDPERSAGPRLYYTEILSRIRRVYPSLVVKEGGVPGHVAVYATLRDERGVPQQKYVGGLPKDWVPEFGHLILDSSLLPEREVIGWRSILMVLVKNGVMTYRQAIEQFGEPRDQRNGRWHEELRKFKAGLA